MQPNSILIIEAITPEAASEETITEINDEVWLSEPNKPVETAIEKSAPFVQKAIYYTRKGFRALTVFVSGTAWPWTHDHAVSAYMKTVDMIKGNDDLEIPASKTKEKLQVLETPKETIEISAPGKEGLEDLTINEHTNSLVNDNQSGRSNVIRIKETDQKPKWLKLEKINLSYAGKVKDNLSAKLKKSKTNQKSLLIIASVVAVILVVSIFSAWSIREGAEKQKLAQASYTEAQSKLTIGKSEAASGNRSQAASTINSALALVKPLKSNQKLKDQAASLENQLNSTLNEVLSITQVSPTELADIKNITGEKAFGPFLIGKSLYLVNKDNGSIAAVAVTGGESSNVLDTPKIDGRITAVAPVIVRSTLVLYTDKGIVYEFDTKDVTLTKQAIAGEMEKTVAMASFSTNIYTVSDDGQIYKRTKTTTGYSARSSYITDGSKVSGTVSLAIDSNVYIMKANGEVTKYLGGKKQDFSLNDLPISITNASDIFTDENTKGAYITEGNEKRIIKMSPDGKYAGQYLSDSLAGASASYVDDIAKTVYTFTNGILYTFGQ